jgi:hypothetical protein
VLFPNGQQNPKRGENPIHCCRGAILLTLFQNIVVISMVTARLCGSDAVFVKEVNEGFGAIGMVVAVAVDADSSDTGGCHGCGDKV